MIIKGFTDGDFVNYKKPAFLIEFPYCTGKCDKEAGTCLCQGRILNNISNIDIKISRLYEIFSNSIVSKAVTCLGLEPLDSFKDLLSLIDYFRSRKPEAKFVIYTGYTEEEVIRDFRALLQYKNLVIKFGRFIPNQKPHFDRVLGVNLASDNQYAKEY